MKSKLQCYSLPLKRIHFMCCVTVCLVTYYIQVFLLPKCTLHGKIPLIWLAWDQTGAELPSVLDYQTVPILTWVLTSNFLLLLLYFGSKSNQRSIPFGYLPIGWFAALQSSSMFCWVFIAEEIDGVGDKGLGDTTTVDVHTPGSLCEHISEIHPFDWWTIFQ